MRVLAKRQFIFSTALGTVMVDKKVVEDFEVDDAVTDLATAQARTIQLLNLGREIDANANIPQSSIPSVFLDPDGQDEEEIL